MSKNKKLKAAVIGLGMGKSHLNAYAKNPNVKIVAICDTNETRLKKLKCEYKLQIASTNYKTIINNPDIDIISIASPDYCHKEQCLDALAAGKHILCEKPLALTETDCNEITEAANKSQSKFMVGQICRYSPSFVMAKKIIEAGDIGELFFVESEYCHNYSEAGGVDDWRKSKTHLRHPFLGGACHAVDLLRWIAGEVNEVFAYSSHQTMLDWPADDFTIALMKFANNITGKTTCSIGCVRPYSMRSVFYGSKGTIICDNTSPEIKLSSKNLSIEHNYKFTSIPVDICSHNIDMEINEFVDLVINDKPIKLGAQEGAKTVAVCLAAIASAKSGQPVTLK